MAEQYILYSIKHHGYWLRGGVYGSDIKQAQHFSRSAAIEHCKKHVDYEGHYGMVMLHEADLHEVSEK